MLIGHSFVHKKAEFMKKYGASIVLILKFIAAILVVILIQSSIIYCIYLKFNDWSASGAFGDTFGATNSLFSGLALAGLIYTVILQTEELKIQREELKLTRDQVTEQAEAQKKQARYTLLICQLNALTSRQEQYTDLYINGKTLDPKIENFETMRQEISKLKTQIDKLLEEANHYLTSE